MKEQHHNWFKLWFDRLLSKSLWRQLAILAVVLAVAFGMSYALLSASGAEWEAFCEAKKLDKWLLPLYLLIDTNALNNLYIDSGVHGWMLFASSLTFLFGAFIFNGAIISILTNAIEQRVYNHKEGKIHYLKSGHYVIMGYDAMVPSIIGDVFEREPEAYVLLMTAADTQTVAERLKKTFTDAQLKHVIINYGHRMSTEYYKDIHLQTAAEIYIVGLRSLLAHDAVNVEVVDSVCRYLEKFKGTALPRRITCVFENLDTYGAFKTSEIFEAVKELGIEFVPYNFYSGWAKQVFVKRRHKDKDDPIQHEIEYPAVYGEGITPEDEHYVHLVFVGTTHFAVAFAMEAANVLHFPNFNKNPKLKTRITFIDKNADEEKDLFITRNRHFFEVQSCTYIDYSEEGHGVKVEIPALSFVGSDADFLDVEFEFIKGDIFSKKVQDEVRRWANDKKRQYLSIFLAMADQDKNFIMGMNMPDEVYDNEIPVFIRQDRSDNFVTNLRKTDEKVKEDKKSNTYYYIVKDELKGEQRGGRYAHVYPFGMNEASFCADEVSLKRAKLINYLYATADYNAYKFPSILGLDALPPATIWAAADAEWRQLSVALKWSNLYSAYAIRTKLATLRAMRGLKLNDDSHDHWTLSDDEVEQLARVEHNRWNVEKLLMGYRKPHRNEDKYAHPDQAKKLKQNKNRFIHHDIRPFGGLDKVRELDREFSRYIPWIMRMTQK